VYAAHSYLQNGALRNRLVRLRWDGQTLGAPEVLLSNIPASGIHDGSRLAIGPDRLLYMTTGDASNGDLAQDRTSLAGKVLRLTLTGQPAPGNPFGSAVYSYGHRNPQGFVFHPTTGALYSTEHGPSDNDEVNLIVAGRNYGWPTVHGLCDDDIGKRARVLPGE
jgi:glucose/arabinose dehydrogenase